MSTPPILELPDVASVVRLDAAYGPLAAVDARPPKGIAQRGTALLVPGFTGSKEDFIAVLEPLACAGYRVVAIDQRGQHESPHAPDESGYSIDALAEDVVTIGRSLDAPVHLLGHSFGGLVARAAAIKAPDVWRSLVLMCSGPAAIPAPSDARLRQFLAAAPVLDRAAIWQAMQQLDAAAGVPRPAPEIQRLLDARWFNNDLASVQRMAEQLLDEPDRVDELCGSRVPTLVLFGLRDDAWPPTLQQQMAERLDAPVARIENAGHSPAAEAPAVTAEALTRWWSGRRP